MPFAFRPLKAVVFVHRWLGVCLCLMFALWFASGAVLIYVPFPSLSDEQRLAHVSPVDTSRVLVAPDAAITASGFDNVDRVRLIQAADRPVYVAHPRQGSIVAVGADDGQKLTDITSAQAAAIAAEFSGRNTIFVEGPLSYDQWIVHQRFDPYRPLFRVSIDDAQGTQLYVSARSGDVVQQTRRNERTWNYFGAVVHWLYPTLLRKDWARWDSVVWWLSLIGLVMAALGFFLGIVRTAKSLRAPQQRALSPFRGWFRWHHITGLFTGVFLLTWIFSGWLSMDHGRLFTSGMPDNATLDRYRGISVSAAASRTPAQQIAALGPIREAEIVALGGQAFLITRAADASTKIVSSGEAVQSSMPSFDDVIIAAAVRAAWPHLELRSVGPIADDDAYGHLITEPLSGATRRIVLSDTPPTWVHVDASSGRIVGVMDASRRTYRWLFTGLHDFDAPGLSNRKVLRQVLILLLLAAGFGLSITGAVLGLKRLRRTFT